MINQIVSVGLISNALGAAGLQHQFLAISFVSWFSLTLFGMHTSLPALLIRSSDRDAFASTARTALALAVIGGTLSLGVTLLILNYNWIEGLSSAPVATAAICNAVTIALSLSERVLQATDRIAQFNLLTIAGTALSLSATFVFSRLHGTASDFVLAYFLGMFFSALVATLISIPRLRSAVSLSPKEYGFRARQLVGLGAFGLGYELAAFCKLQAPLALLSALGLQGDIAQVGLGLRLIALASGGLSIIVPILFLRIGVAIQAQDEAARRTWTRLGLISSFAIAFAAAGSYLIFGQVIYQGWTGGVISLEQSNRYALAAFSALSLMQALLFTLAAPDPVIAKRLRWLFWLEGPAVLAAGVAGTRIAPAGSAGMLAGFSLVMAGTVIALLVFLLRSRQQTRARQRA